MRFLNDLFNKKRPDLPEEQKREMQIDLAQRMKKLFPDETTIGQPFWGLMEVKDGHLTGNYFVIPNEGGSSMPLFISKYHAEAYLAHRPSADRKLYSVRGITQEQVRFLAITAEETKKILFAIFLHQEEGTNWKVRQIDGKMLKAEFVWD